MKRNGLLKRWVDKIYILYNTPSLYYAFPFYHFAYLPTQICTWFTLFKAFEKIG